MYAIRSYYDFPPPEYQISIVHGKMKAADKEYEIGPFAGIFEQTRDGKGDCLQDAVARREIVITSYSIHYTKLYE